MTALTKQSAHPNPSSLPALLGCKRADADVFAVVLCERTCHLRFRSQVIGSRESPKECWTETIGWPSSHR